MTPLRSDQVAEIARAALEHDEGTREAFLRGACLSDTSLRSEVNALLATLRDPPGAGESVASTPGDRPTDSGSGFGVAYIQALVTAAGQSDHYQDLSVVGRGGSGVVCRAIDTRLRRAVAIKAVHASRPFERHVANRLRAEALAAASLDHPYICKIYDLIEIQGEQLIVMEFVEGQTLAHLLDRGVPPLATTLRLTIEIAEGLAAAHERGLVHRDLKPANVMLTSNGHVKLLDFGLARAGAAVDPAAETRTSPGLTDAYAGTPHYMAPEQAEGRPVTPRTDVFSLGVVLFECLTGKLPFEGESPYDYVRHLLTKDATPVHRIAPDAPAALARLIDRCLDRTPAQRPDSAAAMIPELKQVLDAISSSGGEVRSISADRARRQWQIIGATSVLAVLGILGWRWVGMREGPDAIWRSQPFVTAPSEEFDSRISPDGRWISFLSTIGDQTQILVRRLEGGQAQRVTTPAGKPISQLWSSDGSQIAYVLRQGDRAILQVVPAFFGGVPTRSIPIVTVPTEARLLRWMDSTIYMQMSARSQPSLYRVDLDRGAVTVVNGAWTSTGTLGMLDVSPDGSRVVFAARVGDREDLWVAPLDGRAATRLTDDAAFEHFPLWSGSGDTVLYQSNRGGQVYLWQVSVTSRRSSQLTSSQTGEEPESTSSDGTLVSFRQLSDEAHVWRWNPATGAKTPLTADALSDWSPSIAAASSAMVFQRSPPSALSGNPVLQSTMFLAGTGGPAGQSDPRSLADGFAPSLSPDGSALAYLQSDGKSARATLLLRNLRNDRVVVLSSTCPIPGFTMFPIDFAERNVEWNASGSVLYFVDRPDVSSIRAFGVGDEAPRPPLVSGEPGAIIHDLHLSPDGQLLAYVASIGHTSSLHLLDVGSGSDRTVMTSETRFSARGWLPNGDGIVLVRATGFDEDFTATLEVIVATPAGAERRVALVDRAFLATTRFDPVHGVLYFTRSEAGIHNVYALSLATRAVTPVTDNKTLGVTFSGVNPIEAGALVGIQQERKSDIWLLNSAPATQQAAGATPR